MRLQSRPTVVASEAKLAGVIQSIIRNIGLVRAVVFGLDVGSRNSNSAMVFGTSPSQGNRQVVNSNEMFLVT